MDALCLATAYKLPPTGLATVVVHHKSKSMREKEEMTLMLPSTLKMMLHHLEVSLIKYVISKWT
jgi:hypothetical protein